MTDRRLKPCATCGHGKSLHRVRSCNHHTARRGQTFMGIGTVVTYCQCRGYEPTHRQATKEDQ